MGFASTLSVPIRHRRSSEVDSINIIANKMLPRIASRAYSELYGSIDVSLLDPEEATMNSFNEKWMEIGETKSILTSSNMLSEQFNAEPMQTFEPIINVPALSSFLLIAVVFSALQIRISSISGAATRRNEALKELRQIKSMELSAADIGGSDNRPGAEAVANALSKYENALREELELRKVIPGVRISAPNDPRRDETELSAARQFLGMSISEEGEVIPMSEEMPQQRSIQTKDETNEEGMSNGAKAVLAAIALSQVILLIVLSFDPLNANNAFFGIGFESLTDILPTSS